MLRLFFFDLLTYEPEHTGTTKREVVVPFKGSFGMVVNLRRSNALVDLGCTSVQQRTA